MRYLTEKNALPAKARKTGCEQATLLRLARIDTALGEAARNALIEHYDGWITRRCRQILKNEANAQDAAQEVKISMYRALSRFEGRSSIRTWLNRMIHNQCVTQLRKQQRTVINHPALHELSVYEDCLGGDQPVAEWPVDAVRKVLQALPAQARDVLQLRFYKELALEDISIVLGISLSSAKMRLYRALEQFQGRYIQFAEELNWGRGLLPVAE